MSTFDERASDWDTPERRDRAKALAAVIRASVPLGPTMRAIDIGAGTGLLGIELAQDVAEMVLAEPSEGMLAVAREKLASGAWQTVTADRVVEAVDEPRCISCHTGCGVPPDGYGWTCAIPQ